MMKKNRNLFANLDRDSVCFAVAVLILSGIGATVAWDVAKDFVDVKAKKENKVDVSKIERDTATVKSVSVMELVSTKQK